VLVDVKIPTKLSREQREALEAYAAASGESNVGGKGGVLDRIKDALG
jgi:DnaJ-class molecular chaperone